MFPVDIDTELGYKLRNEKEVNKKICVYITEPSKSILVGQKQEIPLQVAPASASP